MFGLISITRFSGKHTTLVVGVSVIKNPKSPAIIDQNIPGDTKREKYAKYTWRKIVHLCLW